MVKKNNNEPRRPPKVMKAGDCLKNSEETCITENIITNIVAESKDEVDLAGCCCATGYCSRSRSKSRSPSRSDSYRRRRSRSRSRSRSSSRSPRHRRDSSGRRRDQDQNYRSGPQDGFLEKRITQREAAMPSRAVWARSPPRPVDEDEESRSDSNSANRRMHRKEGKKDKRKHKDKKHRDKKEKRDKKDKRDKRKSKKRKRSRSRDSNDRDRKRQRKERESSSSESENSDEEQVWTEKKVVPAVVNTTEEEDFGPTPLHQVGAVQKYGGQMLPGEAEAYAQYVQQNKRIPRRGEVGMSNEQIDNMENLGYVMSGNRNKRMTAVRIRKENQVLTAEEKRQLVQTTLEEKAKKENKIIADMRELVAQKFKQQQQ